MANVEISDLVNKATPVSTDEFEIQATVGGASNKVTLANIALNLGTADAAVVRIDGANALDQQNTDELFVGAGAFSLVNIRQSTSINGALTCAAFTSTGIDDNATGERIQIADLGILVGAATGDYKIAGRSATSALIVGAGDTAGAELVMFGSSHATLADDFVFRNGADVNQLQFDDSTSTWDFQANAIVTTGDTAVAGLTLTGLLKKSVTDTITAGATQTQAGATALTTDMNRVTVVATANDGVKLPTAVAGLEILIVNDDSTDALQVWPATGDAIDGGGANAVDANTLAAGAARRYISVDATDWYTA